MPRSIIVISAFLAVAAPCAGMAWATEPTTLTLKDHGFSPAEIRVPAHERFRIVIVNQDATPAEFESSDLRAEKIVVPGGRIIVTAGPLQPGTYAFHDDYHPDTARGSVIVAERQAGK